MSNQPNPNGVPGQGQGQGQGQAPNNGNASGSRTDATTQTTHALQQPDETGGFPGGQQQPGGVPPGGQPAPGGQQNASGATSQPASGLGQSLANASEALSIRTLIPQSRTGDAGNIAGGLSWREWALVVVPVIFAFVIPVRFLDWTLSYEHFMVMTLSGLVPFLAIRLSPWYLTPTEIIARTVGYWARTTRPLGLRIPFVGDSALDVPGVVEVHAEHDAVEETDGTLTAYIDVNGANTSVNDRDQWITFAYHLSRAIHAQIATMDGDGFDFALKVSKRTPNPLEQVSDLDDASENEAIPKHARRFAAEHADRYLDQLAQSGAMERRMFIAVPVAAGEVEAGHGGIVGLFDSIGYGDWLRTHTRTSSKTREQQAAKLDRRVQAIESAVGSVGSAQQMDTNGIVRLFRRYWLDVEPVIDYTALAQSGVMLPSPERRVNPGEESNDGEVTPPPETDAPGAAESPTTRRQRERREADIPEQPRDPVADAKAARDADENTEQTDPEPDDVDPGHEDDGSGGSGLASQYATRFSERMDRGIIDRVRRAMTTTGSHLSKNHRDKRVLAPALPPEPQEDVIKVGDEWLSTIFVANWPREPPAGFFEGVLDTPDVRFTVSFRFDAEEFQSKVRELKKKRNNLDIVSILFPDGNEDADDLANDHDDLRRIMKDEGMETFSGSAAITVRGKSETEVRDARSTVMSRCSASEIVTAPAYKRQLAGIKSTSPTARDDLNKSMKADISYDMPEDVLGALAPFGGAYLRDPNGTIYGLAKTGLGDRGDPVGLLQVDRRRRGSPHRSFVGQTGAGKSVDVKDQSVEDMLRREIQHRHTRRRPPDERIPNQRTVIVDIARGFDGVVELLDGTKVEPGTTVFNPFATRPFSGKKRSEAQTLDDKVKLIADMYMIHLHAVSPGDASQLRPWLTEAIRRTYKEAGITHNPNSFRKDDPVHADLMDALEEMERNPGLFTARETKSEINNVESAAGNMLTWLAPFEAGGDYDFLCGDAEAVREESDRDVREVDLYDDVVYFDLFRYQHDKGPAKAMLLLYVVNLVGELGRTTDSMVNVVIDEAHDLFRDAAQAESLESRVRAGRNAGTMYDFLSQADEDFDAESAYIIMKQCSIVVWHNLVKVDEITPGVFGLTQTEINNLPNLAAGANETGPDYAEAIVDVDGDHYYVEQQIPDWSLRAIDYRAADDGAFDEYLEGIPIEEQEAYQQEMNAESPTPSGTQAPTAAQADGGRTTTPDDTTTNTNTTMTTRTDTDTSENTRTQSGDDSEQTTPTGTAARATENVPETGEREPRRDMDAAENGDCGYPSSSRDGAPCKRTAGWGNLGKIGYCSPHLDRAIESGEVDSPADVPLTDDEREREERYGRMADSLGGDATDTDSDSDTDTDTGDRDR